MTTIHDILNDLKQDILKEAETTVENQFVADFSFIELIDEAEKRIFDLVDQIKE